MIGKFIVYESYVRHRYRVSEVEGETKEFWKVITMRRAYRPDQAEEPDHHRLKKSSLEIMAVRDTREEAKSVAEHLNQRMSAAHERYTAELQAIRAGVPYKIT